MNFQLIKKFNKAPEKGQKQWNGTKQNYLSKRDSNIEKNKSKLQCYVCGKYGHKAYQCFQRRGQQHSSGKSEGKVSYQENLAESDEVIAAVVFEANMVENKSDWVLDTGASRHFCANQDLFNDFEDVAEGGCVYMGN